MNFKQQLRRVSVWIGVGFALGLGFRPEGGVAAPDPNQALPEITVHTVQYSGNIKDQTAQFTMALDLEVVGKGSKVLTILSGEMTVVGSRLPPDFRLERSGKDYRLIAGREGRFKMELDLVARVIRNEPWNQVVLNGPEAVVGSVDLQTVGKDLDVELLTGVVVEKTVKENGVQVRGILGNDRRVSIRWQSRAMDMARKAVLTSEVGVSLQVLPTVVKYTSNYKFDILQGVLPRLVVKIPAGQSLTQVQGEEIRDWQIRTEAGGQILAIEFLKPVEKAYGLTLLTEQAILDLAAGVVIDLPHPQDVDRETGRMTLRAEDVVVEAETAAGLRQINAAAGAVAAYQFHTADFGLKLKLRRIEPVVTADDRVTVRVEEARVMVQHLVGLNIEKAGLYAVELNPPKGFVVAEVRGEDVTEWKLNKGVLQIHFGNRVLGARALDIQLEQALRRPTDGTNSLPALTIEAIRVTGAIRETAQIGVVPAGGIQLKAVTEKMTGLRELSVALLPSRGDATLAYQAEQAEWSLVLRADRLQPKVTAEVFNLIAVGDGLLGGSATIRYAILNQGVQEFRVQVPALWKNVDFTGPNIRRKELQGEAWVISLQDKVWGGYSLVVTYDYQFDPHQATLPVGGIHPEGVERETGSIAITSAGNLKLNAVPGGDAIRRIDETELSESDRALISRPVLLAYRYQGGTYGLSVEVNRYEELPILDAAADHMQLTTVLTEDGQMLTQASFMIKNNDRQFQMFTLPEGADFWSCYVKGESAKPERKGAQLLIPLPRDGRRDQAFAVDIVYAQKVEGIRQKMFQPVRIEAPKTDMQTTYAEWEVFVPEDCRLARFAGNMIIARGTTYGFYEAWREWVRFFERNDDLIFPLAVGVVLVGVLVILGFVIARKGYRGCLLAIGGALAVLLLLAIAIPSITGARSRSRAAMAEVVLPPEPVAAPDAEAEPRDLGGSGGGFVSGKEASDSPLVYGNLDDIRGSGAVGQMVLAKPGSHAFISPVTAGLKSLRIEIPRTGQRYVFTKVLNVRNELLTIQALTMKRKAHERIRSGLQGVAILVGLLLMVWQWRRADRHSLVLALGLALMAGGLISCLIQYRLLGDLLAWGAVFIGFAIPIAIVVWVCFKIKSLPKSEGKCPPAAEPPLTPPPVPPILTTLLVAVCLAQAALAVEPIPLPVEPASASLLSAVYKGEIRTADPKSALRIGYFDATFDIQTERDNQTVFLMGNDVALQGFEVKSSQGWGFNRPAVKLVRNQGQIGVFIPRKGAVKVQLRYLVKLQGDTPARRFQFGLPDALLSRALITLDEPDATVEIPGAIALTYLPPRGQDPGALPVSSETRVEAVLSNTNRLEMTWTPKIIRAADIAATLFCQNAARVTFDGGALQVAATLDYQVMQGELKTLRVRLPAGQRLMRVEGQTIRTWTVEKDILTVELMKGIASRYRLLVETEKPQGVVSTAVKIEIPHPIDITRETGLVGFMAQDEVSLSYETQDSVQKIDSAEFNQALKDASPAGGGEDKSVPLLSTQPVIAAAYRFLKPDFGLRVRLDPVLPQIEAVVRNVFRIGSDQIALDAEIQYTIKRAGTFTLQIGLPEGYRLEQLTGTNLSQWVLKNGRESGGGPVVEVTLKERAQGAYRLNLELVRFLNPLPASLNLTGAQPLGIQKLSGVISVSAEEGIQIKSERFEGLSEIPVAAVAGMVGAGLGFKILPGDAGDGLQSPWTLTLATESMQAWVRAEVVTLASLTENLVNGRSQVRYEILNAPTRLFRLRVPAAYRNVDVTGRDIRRKDYDEKNREWTIELQNKVRGTYLLTATWDLPWQIKEGGFDFGGVEVMGVERETGILAISVPVRLRLDPHNLSSDLQRLDKNDVPSWAGTPAEPPVLVVRYLRPGYKLGLKVEQFEDAEVLQALAENVRLTTVVAEDGQIMTEMALSVRNNARQYLEMELPETAQVWSAFVGGQPVRPSRKNGKLLIPMERTDVDLPVEVELTFVGATPFPSRKGKVNLISPALDIPFKNAQWDLFLPADYLFSGFDGSMKKTTPEVVLTRNLVPVSATYSYDAYQKDEKAAQVKEEATLKSDLWNVKSNLSGGKLREANDYYQRARRSKGKMGNDLGRLEGEVKKAQALNLVNAQQQFVADNSEVVETEQPQARQGGRPSGMNAPVQLGASQQALLAQDAELQWDKVQAAQEVAESKSLPLRINLPRRGIQLSFQQVLQTEVGKPMTVEFQAANQKSASWIKVSGIGGLGFAVLWGLVALGVRAFARRRELGIS
jgi:hypothetical protein